MTKPPKWEPLLLSIALAVVFAFGLFATVMTISSLLK
jgi:hypothetical protein